MKELSINQLMAGFAVNYAREIASEGVDALPSNITINNTARATRLSEEILLACRETGLVDLGMARRLLCIVGLGADIEIKFSSEEIKVRFAKSPLPGNINKDGGIYGQSV